MYVNIVRLVCNFEGHPCVWHRQGDLESVYRSALALGTANQLTNILRDVGEDVNERNRIYVPLDELHQFGIRESEVRMPLCLPARQWTRQP